jgi:hypothetical protein
LLVVEVVAVQGKAEFGGHKAAAAAPLKQGQLSV